MISDIQKIISRDFTIDLTSVPLSTTFKSLEEQDSSFDSLSLVAFIIEVEKHFNVELPAKINTIEELLNEIEKGLKK